MVSDSISDLIATIKNGYLAKHKSIEISHFNLGETIAKLLSREGYLGEVKISGKDKKRLLINLKYDKKAPVLTDIIRLSRPGLRVYVAYGRIPRVLSGLGAVIISTPKGVMTGKEARKLKLGGELLFKVW